MTKGHWPKGKPRNEVRRHWAKTREAAHGLVTDHFKRGVCSIKVLAEYVGVSDRSVGRWLNQIDYPAPDHQDAVREWCRSMTKEVKSWA